MTNLIWKVEAQDNYIQSLSIVADGLLVKDGSVAEITDHDIGLEVHAYLNKELPENYDISVNLLGERYDGTFSLADLESDPLEKAGDILLEKDDLMIFDGRYSLSVYIENKDNNEVVEKVNDFHFIIENDSYRQYRPVIINLSKLKDVYYVGDTLEWSMDYTSLKPIDEEDVTIEFYSHYIPLQSPTNYEVINLSNNQYRVIATVELKEGDIGEYTHSMLNLCLNYNGHQFDYDARKFAFD